MNQSELLTLFAILSVPLILLIGVIAMLKTRPEPKSGYQLVDSGKVKKNDLVWDVAENIWSHPKNKDYRCLGGDVYCYYAVCRKI